MRKIRKFSRIIFSADAQIPCSKPCGHPHGNTACALGRCGAGPAQGSREAVSIAERNRYIENTPFFRCRCFPKEQSPHTVFPLCFSAQNSAPSPLGEVPPRRRRGLRLYRLSYRTALSVRKSLRAVSIAGRNRYIENTPPRDPVGDGGGMKRGKS